MPLAQFNQMIWDGLSESKFQKQVVDKLTEWAGFDPLLIYHTHISKRSQHGFPDLDAIRTSRDRIPPWIECRRPRHLVIELKTEKGTFTLDQVRRLNAYADLREHGHLIEVYALRPSLMEPFEAVLQYGPGVPGGLTQWPHGWEEDIAKARPVRSADKKDRVKKGGGKRATSKGREFR